MWDGCAHQFGVEEEIDDWYDIDEDELLNFDDEEVCQEPIIDDESREVYVLCWDCKREIEFGWSHENQQGKIWPAESPDFNPWKSWLEPRYIKSWQEKKMAKAIKIQLII